MDNEINNVDVLRKNLEKILNDAGLFDGCLGCEDEATLSDIDLLIDVIHRDINQDSIIYYHKAIKYLKKHDNSLSESIELAKEAGYELGDINSEILATLHNHNRLIDLIPHEELEEQLEIYSWLTP